MAKRKKSDSSQSNTKAAAIILGFFVAGIVLFFVFSKNKESARLESPVVRKIVEVTRPIRNIEPQEHVSEPQETETEPVEKIAGSGSKIAFIIDDWGQSMGACKYLKEIPEPVAVSILPGLRHTKDVANCAQLYHKLIMLHLPLEAMHNSDFYPHDYIIKTTMKPALVSKIVNEDIDQLPAIEGVNNHMGSKATSDRALMSIIFKIVKKRGLFFVDSKTSASSVCSGLADEMGLAFGKRDVFLDNVITREAIHKQFVILAQKARHRGYAVAIGHAFNRLTMQMLKEEIPLLERQGFKIVSIKDLLQNN